MSQIVMPKIECVESSEAYGRFVAEPVERGWGITLGNALRRVLLSSLPGVAVTWVKIEGVQHEFSTIPHMKEDVIDFLLNVKAIRLRPYGDRPGKLFLEVEGEGEVCAADIKPSADFEIVNQELHLSTLQSPEARLYVEFNVEHGRGFKASFHSGDGSSLPLGELLVDAIFSPVRRVSYEVESVSAGLSTNDEKVILEIWTDGTITPAEALSKSARILIERLEAFATMSRPVPQPVESKSRAVPSEQYNVPIEQLTISPRTMHNLRRNRITKLGELLELSPEELLSLKKFGQKSLEEVLDCLRDRGLSLAPDTKKKQEAP